MGWADWMVVTQSLEEELHLEQAVREIEGCEDLEVLTGMCVALTRQSWHQGKLLNQAVGHIAERDAWEEASAP